MITRTPLFKIRNLLVNSTFKAAFQKFNFEDALNLKSLLTEE